MRIRSMPGLAAASLLASLSLFACKAEKPEYKPPAAKCATDKDCAKGFICQEGGCVKGERSPEEIAQAQKAAREAKEKALAAAKETKPGEGRLHVRLCPGFQNTIESLGTLVATHVETGKEHVKHLALEVPEGGWETEFTFWSVPLGEYTVTAKYGIQVRGKPDISQLKCHEKVDKKLCSDGLTLSRTVVSPDQEPPRVKDKEGNELRRPCDFIAE